MPSIKLKSPETEASGVDPLEAFGGAIAVPAAADLYCDLPPGTRRGVREYLPGLAVSLMALLAALFIAEHYGAPATLMGLLIGMSLNFLGADKRLEPGFQLTTTTLLRFGIVLLGARVTLGHFVELGLQSLLALVVTMSLTMLSALLLSRLLRTGTAFGLLAGGAVAICGASAALALASVLTARLINRSQLALVLVGISVMSALAVMLYPALAHLFGLSGRQAGFFIGASIHDVAQALGAGYAFSDEAGQTATIVKLTRVALLAPVLMIVSLFFVKSDGGKAARATIPPFLIGFMLLVAINSTGVIPAAIGGLLANLGSILVVAAVTTAAISSPVKQVIDCGPRPLLVIAGATLVAAASALTATMLIL